MTVNNTSYELESKNYPIKKRIFNNYTDALREHYIEECKGKIYYNYLYQIFSDKYVLHLLTQVEKLMCELLTSNNC